MTNKIKKVVSLLISFIFSTFSLLASDRGRMSDVYDYDYNSREPSVLGIVISVFVLIGMIGWGISAIKEKIDNSSYKEEFEGCGCTMVILAIGFIIFLFFVK